VKWYWPELTGPKESEKAAHGGASVCFLVAGVTATLAGMSVWMDKPVLGMDAWALADAGIFAVAGWRFWRLSRIWAVLALAMFIAESVYTIAPHHLPTVDPNPSSQSTPGYSPNSPFAQAVRNLGMDRPEVDEDTYDKFRNEYFDRRIAPRLLLDQLETQRQIFLQRTQRPKTSTATYPSTLAGIVAIRAILILALIGGVRGTFAHHGFISNARRSKPCRHGVIVQCQLCEAEALEAATK